MLESDLDNLSYLLQLKPANFRAIRYKLFRDLSDATADISKPAIFFDLSTQKVKI